MPADVGPIAGLISLVAALDATDPDAFWLNAVWTDAAAQAEPVRRRDIKAGIDLPIPLIAAWGTEGVTVPVGVIPARWPGSRMPTVKR